MSENTDDLREACLDTLASLTAAVSLLKRGSKKAAPSDRMFDQMILDYEGSIERARAALAAPATDAQSDGLREALEPFAHAIDALDRIREGKPGEREPNDDRPIFVTWGSKGSGKDAAITFGDLRRARAALAAKAADKVPVVPGWAPKKLLLEWSDSITFSGRRVTAREPIFHSEFARMDYNANQSDHEVKIAEFKLQKQADFDRRVRECVDAPARDGEVERLHEALRAAKDGQLARLEAAFQAGRNSTSGTDRHYANRAWEAYKRRLPAALLPAEKETER